jgi:hypothetical protein
MLFAFPFPMAFSPKILQLYHKVVQNKGKESGAGKKLDHSPIMAHFGKEKATVFRQDLNTTDEVVELDGASISSADFDTSTYVERQPFSLAELTVFFCRHLAWK